MSGAPGSALAAQRRGSMPRVLVWLDRHPWLWLILGVVLLVLTQVRAGIGVLAWVGAVPWLRHLRLTNGWRSRLLFAGALFLGWALATAKIASEPSMLALAPIFALPIALAQLLAYLTWDVLRPRTTPVLAAASFSLAIAVWEWVLYSLTPFGSWGATAYTQLDDLPLLQAASVVGIAGTGAIVNFVAASIEGTLAGVDRSRRVVVIATGLALVAHVAGSGRLALADVSQGRTIVTAAVATDSNVRGLPLPEREATHQWDRTLLERTRAAARGGAVLAVWPEAATLVWPDEEAEWIASVSAVAREGQIDVVAAYVMPTSATPFAYRNEYRLVLRDGSVQPAYAKHHPVPGEPAIAGVGPVPVVEREWGRLSGAICYDSDFPSMGLERAHSGADVVVVPASDWRGIDPVHAQMAALRAIESGHSILRSTRFGLSLAVDPYGRVRAWHSAFESGSGITFADLPSVRVRTLYSVWGDASLAAATALLAGFLGITLVRRSESAILEAG
jgi:apolipoprotein N-acyltransferase